MLLGLKHGGCSEQAEGADASTAATPSLSSCSTNEAAREEVDFGYGVGLNPPEEEEICALSNVSQSKSLGETPSRPAQTSPTCYYGVCPPWEDVLARNERAHVYIDKKEALQAVKLMKGARFKAFSNREDAEKFANGFCDYYPSPSKSTPCVSPVKPGVAFSKGEFITVHFIHVKILFVNFCKFYFLSTVDSMEVDTVNRERANSYKSPRTQDLTAKLRKAVEKGDEAAFSELVWSNPRYLIGSGDNPTIVQEGCRYNVMHVAAKENQAGISQLLLDILENPEFMRLMYPDDQEAMLQKRIRYIVDLYLNTPDKAGFETPLHFACKFGCPEVVNVLCSHPDTDKNCKNKDSQTPSDADDFRRSWKTPPRERVDILKSDPERGAEKVGRDLAHEMGHPWAEYWDFLDSFVDLSSAEGLRKLEEYLGKKDFSCRVYEEAGENETSNRFRTPSPGKLKKFCNSISVGAFLDEGDDISLEEIKNRQNAALTSITSSAAAKDGLKGAVGGLDFHILPRPDLIETAAEQDLLCSCDDGLLSPSTLCKNEVCSSSRDRTHNGDKVSQRTSPSSLVFSHVTPGAYRLFLGLQGEEEQWRQEQRSTQFGLGCRSEHRAASPLSQSQTGHEAAEGPSWTTETGSEERRSSGSSEEYFEAEESLDLLGRTRGSFSGTRNFCARSKSWDHGGRDLSSSGSSSSSYKSLDNSHDFLPRTPPPIRKGLFIEGNSPTKLDSQVLSAIENLDIDPQKYPSIHKWKSTMKLFSTSDMQRWPSPAVVKPRLRVSQTPGSPVSGLMSPARHAASPDFSPSRYSPANASYIQRIRLKHLNDPSV
ncbi:hypothetical protein WMY93_020920 [Mugilogobius chulae]|uniref:ANKLE2 third alpha/beta domain-containing protein n=1 Tax=Mugilogobius chulae TaxID=88201 RepID=A0AAW0NAD5_9GOBI